MLIPSFWAEATVKHRIAKKQITVKRFGWSDESEAQAQFNAQERAEDAFARLVAGEKLARYEPKVAYNGADGVPIREQVLSRHGSMVVTRNLYGARCLNTPNVLFADIDFEDEYSYSSGIRIIVWLFAIAGAVFAKMLHGWLLAAVVFLVILILGATLSGKKQKKQQQAQASPEQVAIERIDAFLQQHPDWHLRVYRTPAGLRLLAMHRTFDPSEAEVAKFFQAINADKVYVRMCLQQQCFRARVSPKPWRIGIHEHMKPRPGVWPINPERLPDRERWVDAYERKSESYASCRFIKDMGSDRIDAAAQEVCRWHDEWCRAESELELA